MIVKNTDPNDLINIDSPEELDKLLEPYIIKFYNNNKIWLHIINIFFWFTFFNLIW